VKWTVGQDGSVKELDQDFRTGSREESHGGEAHFSARMNQTMVVQEEPGAETKVVRPGLALLRIATAGGKSSIEF
jgi:hypothetical protein